MLFEFDKASCQNVRKALRKEWLLTNGLGDYSSSSILCCNTRKYHGLLTANTRFGRHVLLSTLQESVVGKDKEFFFSTRKHPMTMYPLGYRYQENFVFEQWPAFAYRVGDTRLIREIILVRGKSRVIVRWTIGGGKLPPLTLRVRPLLAYRNFHALTHANPGLHVRTSAVQHGFGIRPYDGLPPLYVQSGGDSRFYPSPDWFHDVEYFQEQERGFPYSEDLFQPGLLEIPLPLLPEGGSVYLVAGTEPCAEDVEDLWKAESAARLKAHKTGGGLVGHLSQIGEQFLTTSVSGRPEVQAGYHWFDAWGRDTLVSLPGLTFLAGRKEQGLQILAQVARHLRDGLVPNCFSDDGDHAYNSADASLWYAFAVQGYLAAAPKKSGLSWVRDNAWPALKAIVRGYRKGPGMGIFVDGEGLLHAGDATTQLTWMDAQVNGRPVTPRHGCPVELNALWYNTLALVDHLAELFHEPEWSCASELRALRTGFLARFYVAERGGYLGDVWRDGWLDRRIRPNQLLAVSLPYPVLEEQYHAPVVERVRNSLLTPFGLRTLAPDDPDYRGRYEGDPESRDASYHQGTVWPWWLGHYADALLRAAWEIEAAAEGLLDTVSPLFREHLADAGVGSISEIFDASPPYRPNGCIAQAWSVAECLRMLLTLRKAAPAAYARWERRISQGLAQPATGDTAGVCRVTMTLARRAEQPAAKATAKSRAPAKTKTSARGGMSAKAKSGSRGKR